MTQPDPTPAAARDAAFAEVLRIIDARRRSYQQFLRASRKKGVSEDEWSRECRSDGAVAALEDLKSEIEQRRAAAGGGR